MKRILLGGLLVASFFFVAPVSRFANAADMALKAPPVWYDWTGFYLGLNGGYSWGNASISGTYGTTPFTASESMDGWVFGGQLGYNWEINHSWLVGLEADFQGTGQDGSTALPTVFVPGVAAFAGTTTAALAEKLPWFGTARLRLGILPADHWLLYVTGGLAYGEVDSTATSTFGALTASSSASNTQIGWTVGGGVEWVLAGAWTAKLEYLYMDLGTFNDTFTGVGSYTALATTSHVTDNILRVGLNYRFH